MPLTGAYGTATLRPPLPPLSRRPSFVKMRKIHDLLVLHHTHTDIGYTHAQPVLWELQRRFIDEALDLCERTADWPEPSRCRWTCEVTSPVLHWLERASARQVERFRGLADAGLIGVGAMFCNVTPLFDADELARSLLPVRRLREQLGVPIRTAINHDVNGLPWPLTQLLLDAGVDGLLMGINTHFGGHPLRRRQGFRWVGSDGRPLLAFNGDHYQAFDRELDLKADRVTTQTMAAGLEQFLARLGPDYPYDFVLLTATHPVFADNNPPNGELPGLIRQWNKEDREPVIRFVTPEMLFDRLRQQPAEAIEEHAGDWTDYWNFGSGSSALETAVNRRTRTRLRGAEALRALRHLRGRNEAAEDPDRDRAFWNLAMYDEHTWGAWFSTSHPDRVAAVEQWSHKAGYAYTARSLTSRLMRDELEATAGNPRQGRGTQGVLVYNPSPASRRELVRIDRRMVEDGWWHSVSEIHRLDPMGETLDESGCVMAGPLELGPWEARVVPREELEPAPPAVGASSGEGWIDSPHHRLEFDPATGRVRSLREHESGREWVDGSCPWPLFGFVRETVGEWGGEAKRLGDSRFSLFTHEISEKQTPGHIAGWQDDWDARRVGPCRLEAASSGVSPAGAWLELRFQAAGVEDLVQRITLLGDRRAVRFEASYRKLDVLEPEAIYFAFPLDVPDWRAHFDTADLPAELDAEQLPGACRDWVTVAGWVCVHNGERAATLVCPDAPLVQVGGFRFGLNSRQIADRSQALLLGWPMNNYWNTNFRASQPGPYRVRYELHTHESYDPALAASAAASAAPLEAHPVVTLDQAEPVEGLQVQGEGVTPLGLAVAQSGDGVVLRLGNVLDHDSEALMRLPQTPAEARWCDTLERPGEPVQVDGGTIRLTLPPRSVRAVLLRE